MGQSKEDAGLTSHLPSTQTPRQLLYLQEVPSLAVTISCLWPSVVVQWRSQGLLEMWTQSSGGEHTVRDHCPTTTAGSGLCFCLPACFVFCFQIRNVLKLCFFSQYIQMTINTITFFLHAGNMVDFGAIISSYTSAVIAANLLLLYPAEINTTLN